MLCSLFSGSSIQTPPAFYQKMNLGIRRNLWRWWHGSWMAMSRFFSANAVALVHDENSHVRELLTLGQEHLEIFPCGVGSTSWQWEDFALWFRLSTLEEKNDVESWYVCLQVTRGSTDLVLYCQWDLSRCRESTSPSIIGARAHACFSWSNIEERSELPSKE